MENTAIQQNSTLQGGKYKIISTLGQGGFGITYLAEQTMLKRKVAIKEFFMKELCDRDATTSHVTLGTKSAQETVMRFREKFIKEARNLARLNHPHIVRIIDVFEENDTAYYVMDYAEGGSLAGKLQAVGHMPEAEATHYIVQVGQALEYIHDLRMNHLDVKPANVMLDAKGNAVLIDFGLSKQYDAASGNQTSTTPVGISQGYAPMEQYREGGVSEFSPQTDVYALGATFFKLLTGATPPSASDLLEEGLPVGVLQEKGVSARAINVICEAMHPVKRERIPSVREFLNALDGQTISTTPAAPRRQQPSADEETRLITPAGQSRQSAAPAYEEPEEETASDGSSRKYIYMVIAALLAGILAGVGFYFGLANEALPEQAPIPEAVVDSDSIRKAEAEAEIAKAEAEAEAAKAEAAAAKAEAAKAAAQVEQPAPAPVSQKMVYSQDSDGWVNVRAQANSSSEILGVLYNGGDGVPYVGRSGNWIKVNYNGRTGYIHKDHCYVN